MILGGVPMSVAEPPRSAPKESGMSSLDGLRLTLPAIINQAEMEVRLIWQK